MVAKGDSLTEILESLCRLVEEQAKDALASVRLLDGDRLRLMLAFESCTAPHSIPALATHVRRLNFA